VLVTGAGGFVGRRLVAGLAVDHEVVALARVRPHEGLAAQAKWIEHDLAEPLVAVRLPGQVDAVVHLAQSRRYKDFPDGARDIYAVNVHSTFALLEWARHAGAQTFVLASTGGIYPYADRPLTEEEAVRPGSLYFRSKYAAEVLLGAYAELLRPVVLRPFFVYGEGQQGMLIPRLAERIVRGQEIVIEGQPGLRINPVHVDDAVRAFAAALTAETSGVVNVAGPDVVSISELVAALGDAIGIVPIVRHHPTAAEGDLVAATELMRSALGVTPRVGLRDGIGRVAAALAADRGSAAR
jgi:nucleoside-diphosphate-sugar epimerase